MERIRKILLTSTLLTTMPFTQVVNAEMGELEGEITATSQYLWRGIQLTADAALQGELQLKDSSGIHADFFTSSVTGGTELQAAAGYSGAADHFNYDFGGRLYYLPQYDSSNFVEIFFEITMDNFGGKISLSPDSGTYIEGFFATQVMEHWAMGLHIGRFAVDEDDGGVTIPIEDYFDYHVALSRMLEDDMRVEFKLAGTTLDDGEAPMETDNFRTIVSISKKFKP